MDYEHYYKSYIRQMEKLFAIVESFKCNEFDNVLSSIASSVENAQTMDSWICADLHDIARKLYEKKDFIEKIEGGRSNWKHAFNVVLGTCETLQGLDDMEVYRAQMIANNCIVNL